MIEGPVQEININFSGELADVDTAPLTRQIVKGVLSYHLGSEVNIVNSMHLAKSREINIVRQKSSATKGFTNLITLTLKTNKDEKAIAGTLLNGYGPRIVQLDQYPVDIAPEGNLLVVSHNDKPGIVGNLGSLLGSKDVNIATMQVGRKVIGGAAIMVLTVDKPVSKETLIDLTKLPELMSVQEIIL